MWRAQHLSKSHETTSEQDSWSSKTVRRTMAKNLISPHNHKTKIYIYLAHIPERKVKVKAKRREGRSCSLIMRRLWWN